MKPAHAAAPERPAAWQVCALIAVAAFLLYVRTALFGYAYLDEKALILDSREFLSRPVSMLAAFRTDVFRAAQGVGAYYRPMMTVSLILDVLWGGVEPFTFHLTNVLVHAGASGLLFLLLGRLGVGRAAAAFGALAFALHPALAQAAALIVGRNDSLLGLFAFPALVLLCDYSREGGWLRYAGHLLLFLLALFTKETGVVIPIVGLAYLRGVRRERLCTGRTAALAAGWAAAGAFWFLLRRAALQNPLPLGFAQAAGALWTRLPVLLAYFGKTLLPFNLSVLPCIQDSTLVYGAAAAALLAAALLRSKGKDARLALFGLFWFGAFLMPSLALGATTVSDLLNEQRLYLPIVGVFVAVLETDWLKTEDPSRRAWAARVLLLALLAAGAFRHSSHYRDPMSFWTNAVETSPHLPLAHRNLGAMYYLDGKLDPAEAQFKAAIELNANEPMAHGNLGLVYLNRGRLAEAREELAREIAISPRYDDAYFNLGLVYFRLRRFAEAEASWKKALELNPGHLDAAVDQALLYLETDPLKAGLYVRELREVNDRAYQKLLAILGRKP